MTPLDLLIEYLKQVDEVQLLELLDIKSDEILDRFRDRVKERRGFLEKEMELVQAIEASQAEDYTDEFGDREYDDE